jgi:hypothetical protein
MTAKRATKKLILAEFCIFTHYFFSAVKENLFRPTRRKVSLPLMP